MKIKNAKSLAKNFLSDLKEFSFSVAWGRFRRDIPVGSWDKRRTVYENSVLKYLEKNYGHIIDECVKSFDESKSKPIKGKHIWVMWWQGEENMPPIVKACYRRLLKVGCNCKVTLITKDNFSDYLQIPNHIIDKVNNGLITITHFSDLIRAGLLKEYGGVWIDATVYAEYLPDNMFTDEFFSYCSPGMFKDFISRGEWQIFLMGVNKTNVLMMTALRDSLVLYWQHHSCIIDYLLIDFFIRLIENHHLIVREQIHSCEENIDFYFLNLNINEPYDKMQYDEIMCKAPLQKLTYKGDLKESTPEGKQTYYGYILNQGKDN